MRTLLALTVFAVAATVDASTAAGLTVRDGSFETPNLSNGGTQSIAPGSTQGQWSNNAASSEDSWILHEDFDSSDTPDAIGGDSRTDGEDDQYGQIDRRRDGSSLYQSLGTTDRTLGRLTLGAFFAWRDQNIGNTFPSGLMGLYTDAAGTSPLAEKSVTPDLTFSEETITATDIPAGTEVFARFHADGASSGNFQGMLVEAVTIAIPEPGSFALLTVGGLIMVGRRRA